MSTIEHNLTSGRTLITDSARGGTSVETLHELLSERARLIGNRRAYTFQGARGNVTITFAELDQRARAIAAALQGAVQPGDRVLMLFPAGLDFVTGFFGCLYAGALAVPTTYPKPRRPMPRLTSIAQSSGAVAALTDRETLATIEQTITASELPKVKWLAVDTIQESLASQFVGRVISSEDIAFLQYTSGSTSVPKGVMVSHGNLLHNLEMIRRGFGLRSIAEGGEVQTGVFWLPAYHDMGLIGGILESLYVGGHSVLMSPAAFLQRPIGWLEAMSDYRAAITGAPNFAYELAVLRSAPQQRAKLELSNWQVAFCGAEPVRAGTLDRFAEAFAVSGFREECFYPCFGLAEGTLLAAGGDGPGPLKILPVRREALKRHRVEIVDRQENSPATDVQHMVSCGHALAGQEILIVDPANRTPCPPQEVGEIRIRGKSVAQGYWEQPDITTETFHAELAGENGRRYLRTGDLGFMVDDQLFVTGRVKDVIIIRGRNHYPQDIERTVGDAHEALRPDSGAVFTVAAAGDEKLVIVHEVDRQYRKADFDEIIRHVRRRVSGIHELETYVVVLIRHASLPRTTSGKPQRQLCREQYLRDELKVLASWTRPSTVPATASDDAGITAEPDAAAKSSGPQRLAKSSEPMAPDEIARLAERVEGWLLTWLVERAAIPPDEVNRTKPFAEYGLDSLTAVELSQELEDWLDVEVVPTVAWNYPTPATLSIYLANQAGGANQDDAVPALPAVTVDNEFDQLLSEIEGLSDDAARQLLQQETGEAAAAGADDARAP